MAEPKRYVLVGTDAATKKYALDMWGDESPENVARVTSTRQMEEVRQSRDFDGAVVMLIPGWAKGTGLLNEALLYSLAMLDGVGR